MKKVNVFVLRDNLASYLDEVTRTEVPLVVCKYNKPIAVIMPPTKEATEDDFNQFIGFMPGDETGVEFENRVRRGKKEKEYMRKLRKRIT